MLSMLEFYAPIERTLKRGDHRNQVLSTIYILDIYIIVDTLFQLAQFFEICIINVFSRLLDLYAPILQQEIFNRFFKGFSRISTCHI